MPKPRQCTLDPARGLMYVKWRDESGIYTWKYLRRMCPCEECSDEKNAATKRVNGKTASRTLLAVSPCASRVR